jgi:hypothetical protein
MNNKTTMGMNRTGMALSPRMGPEMLKAAEMYSPSPYGSDDELRRVRGIYIAEASPHGTMPPPASLKEAGVTALQMLKGNKALVLMDKLSERAAFERTGSRLYQTLVQRIEAGPSWEGGPTLVEASAIHADELRHFALVSSWVERLGGDPTVVSPCADVTAVASLGLVQVMGDPRVPLRYALEAIMVAELTDNEGWATLIALASAMGQNEMVSDFQQALLAEEEHLLRVRAWLRAGVLADGAMDLSDEPGPDQAALEQSQVH